MYRRIGAADRDWHGRFFAAVTRSFASLPAALWQEWAVRGGWDDRYEAFVRMEDGAIVATVGRTRMALAVDGAPVAGFQLGAVATQAERRGQGVGRGLVEHVLAASEGPVLLFSNPRAVGFYARLGFREVARARAVAHGAWLPGVPAARCDPADAGERARLAALCAGAVPVGGRLAARDYFGVALWHLTCGGRTAFWLPEFGAAVAADQDAGRLAIHDVFAPAPVRPARGGYAPCVGAGGGSGAGVRSRRVVARGGAGAGGGGRDAVRAGAIEGPAMFPGLAHT